MARKPEFLSVGELSTITGKAKPALWKRCRRAAGRDGVLYVNGYGYYLVRRKGREYQVYRMAGDDSAGAVEERLLGILEQLEEYVCEDCREIVEKVSANVRG